MTVTETPVLTQRRLQILAGAANGRQNKEIGAALYLTEDTVKTHMRHAFKALGANDRAHAVAIAIRRQLIRFDSRGTAVPNNNHPDINE